jgi:hypothetical protein
VNKNLKSRAGIEFTTGDGPRNPNKKCIKYRMDSVQMVMGKDVVVKEVRKFFRKTLVRKFSGKNTKEWSLSRWMESDWKPELGYSLVFNVLI